LTKISQFPICQACVKFSGGALKAATSKAWSWARVI
jgi:hypothetical protein